MTRRSLVTLLALPSLLSLVGLLSWCLPGRTPREFFSNGQRLELVANFLYVDISPGLTPAEQTTAKALSDQWDAIRSRGWPGGSRSVTDTITGSNYFVIGFTEQSIHQTIGPLSGTTARRRLLWVSPWAGAVLALLPLIATGVLHNYRRSRARSRLLCGVCPTCAYDLTANTTGICPECGTTIASMGRHAIRPLARRVRSG